MTKRMLVCVIALIVTSGIGRAEPLHHSVTISLFPPDSSLKAADTISLVAKDLEENQVRFLLNTSLSVDRVSSTARILRWYTQEDVDPGLFTDDPDSADLEIIERGQGIFIEFGEIDPSDVPITVEIAYSGVVYDDLEPPPEAYAKGFGSTTGLIDERGVYLASQSLWYPFQFDEMFTFDLRVDVPYDWMSISQGRLETEYVERAYDEERVFTVWVEDNPTPEFYLVAGRYYRHEDYCDSVWIMTYTYEQSDSLSRVYTDATKRYLAMYEHLIGEYPYEKFAMVENFWQTGFGMPSFTLLGSRVIRLPFIVNTSYGHEILHNWWGNSVYVDYNRGNWCEGITTYGADYLYKEQMGTDQARDYRHHTLIAFNEYVIEARDFPLSEFLERYDSASQSIGYGKSLMVFHMLRQSLGDSLFWACLRKFYERSRFDIASWHDIATVFSEISGRDLTWYFDQWVTRTGGPKISLARAGYSLSDSLYQVAFRLDQDPPCFTLDIPIRITTAEGGESLTVRLTGRDSTYLFETRSRPMVLAVDPDYDVFRKLYIEEIPMTLGSMFAQDSVLVVIGSGEDEPAADRMRHVASAWGLGGSIVREDQMEGKGIPRKHLWLLGRGKMVDQILDMVSDEIEITNHTAKIGDSAISMAGNTMVCALRNPHEETLGVAVVLSEDLESLVSAAHRIPHYSRYSYLGFEGTAPTLKGVWKQKKSPLTAELIER